MMMAGVVLQASRGLGYDGPTPLTYDHTASSIRVVLAAPGKILTGGVIQVALTAYVPISIESAGAEVMLALLAVTPGGDLTLGSCTYPQPLEDAGTTAVFTCDLFVTMPDTLAPALSVAVYPKVVRDAPSSGARLEHDGQPFALTLAIEHDDAFESNDTLGAAASLIPPGAPVFVDDLIWRNLDHYRFTAPLDPSIAGVAIRFFAAAANLDLEVLDEDGTVVAWSATTDDDEENVSFRAVPGATYLVRVSSQGQGPAFYDLSITTAAPAVPTITTGPGGAPNPVESGGAASFWLEADSLSQPLAFFWEADCPDSQAGYLSSRYLQNPAWTAPSNMTGLVQDCAIRVEVADNDGASTGAAFVQQVLPVPHVLTITAGPSASPEPVASAGTVAINVAAGDSYGHPLTYAWSATCPGLETAGQFTPTALAQTASWIAPMNATGSPKACTLSVVVSDGVGQTAVGSITQTVAPQTCSFAIDPQIQSTGDAGGLFTLNVTTTAGCAWTGTSNAPWLIIDDSGMRSGPGSLVYTVSQNLEPTTRTATLLVAGQAIDVTQAGGGYRYYFAEGATLQDFFRTDIDLFNPGGAGTADIAIEFLLKDRTNVLTHSLTVDEGRRATLGVADLAAASPSLAPLVSAEFAIIVRSSVPLAVERTMRWDGTGYGSHTGRAVDAPRSTWYLGPSNPADGTDTYYLIQNPNASALDDEIEITYFLPPPQAPVVRTYSMGPRTRTNIAVHLEPGLAQSEVWAVLRTPAAKPVVVERAEYRSAGGLFYGAGSVSAGVGTPQASWYFAEGATGPFFDLFIDVANPNDASADVTATFLFSDGTTCATTTAVGPHDHETLWIDTVTVVGCPRTLGNAAVSTVLTSTLPVFSERTMWWPQAVGPAPAVWPPPSWAEAHRETGTPQPGTRWALAGAAQGGANLAETYVLVANTSPWPGTARVTLYFDDGTTAQRDVALAAASRTNVPIGAADALGGFGPRADGQRFSVLIESLPVLGQPGPAQIVVERATYSDGPGAAYWAAGSAVAASPLP
jgi:hypothetical protein